MSKVPLKPEGNGDVRKETVKTERLPSLFSNTRDLLLKNNQRAQVNKKNYAPNLNVTRNKNADKPCEGPKRGQKSDRGGKNQRGKGAKLNTFNNKKGNLIQTVGFLSEGIASSPVTRRTGDGYGGSSRDAASEPLQRPRIIKRDQKPDKLDLNAEQQTLIDLIGDEDELELDDEDTKSPSDDFRPIKIKDPCKRSLGSKSKMLSIETKVKVEPMDESDVVLAVSDSPENSVLNGSRIIKTEPGTELKSEAFHRMDKLFRASPNDFLLFQLPDTLPGRTPDASDTQQSSTTKSQATNLCSIDHLEDGLIGKLIRYKSGKTKLMIGDTAYDVDLGLASDFNQHAVTINANTAERSASMYSFGQINSKFNVTPDWIHLFHKMTP